MINLINITVNGFIVKVLQNITILQACNKIGVIIPCFCYHEGLFIAGNCRMCLVETNLSPNLVVSCTVMVSKGLEIYTQTQRVRKIRESVLEFLLANHPLDCPICDQGGECDLQDFTLIFGMDRGRFYTFLKKNIEDEFINPLIKTIMTRCIQCTRCVRFSIDITFMRDLGIIGRGFNLEIGNHISKLLHNEFSGNIIDLCPVGALTSKPFSFINRLWDLKSNDCLDILDCLGTNIRINLYNNKIVRVLPIINSNLSENIEWISNQVRFSYDSISLRRLKQPLIRFKELNSLNTQNFKFYNIFIFNKINWINNFFKTFIKIKSKYYFKISFIFFNFYFLLNLISNLISNKIWKFFEGFIGNLVDFDTIFISKLFFNEMGNFNLYFETYFNHKLNVDFKNNYLFNNNFNILNISDFIFLVSINPRLEFPLLNLKLRNICLNNFKIYAIGSSLNYLGYSINKLSNNLNSFLNILQGKSKISQILFLKKFPLFLLGSNLNRIFNNFILKEYLNNIYKILFNLKFKWELFNNLNNNTGRISSFDLGCINYINSSVSFIYNLFNNKQFLNFKNYKISNKLNNIFKLKNKKNLIYLLGSDDFDFYYNFNLETNNFINNKHNVNFIIYQGHHWDNGAYISDIILPGITYFEKESFFSNFLGIYNKSSKVISSLNNMKVDWQIIKIHWILYKNNRLFNTKYKYNFKKLKFFIELQDNSKNILNKYNIFLKIFILKSFELNFLFNIESIFRNLLYFNINKLIFLNIFNFWQINYNLNQIYFNLNNFLNIKNFNKNDLIFNLYLFNYDFNIFSNKKQLKYFNLIFPFKNKKKIKFLRRFYILIKNIKGNIFKNILLNNFVDNYYSINSISRCSNIMGQSVKFFKYNKSFKFIN